MEESQAKQTKATETGMNLTGLSNCAACHAPPPAGERLKHCARCGYVAYCR